MNADRDSMQSNHGPAPKSDAPIPPIENGSEPPPAAQEPITDDDPKLLASATRLVAGDAAESADDLAEPAVPSPRAPAPRDDTSDTAAADEAGGRVESAGPPAQVNWNIERSAHKIIVELKRIEWQVRELLSDRDTKTKRKLAGTRRWLELQEDLMTWRYTDQFDQATLDRLQELVARRHYLFQRLRFVASTRPTLNS